MAGNEFFNAPEDQNLIKTELVFRYFDSWSTIMLSRMRNPNDRIAYIDLFAGPGRYDNGSPSTPLWILEHAVKNPGLCTHLVTMFNDREPAYAERLGEEIAKMEGIERLKYQPQIASVAVGTDLVKLLRSTNFVPTLFFIDPWGYKGLSLDLIGTAVKNWGCDCIFFFNYNRINPALGNAVVDPLINDLFGAERAEILRQKVAGKNPEERQAIILSELTEALKLAGGKFVLPFEFQASHSVRTSHYIIFVSKAFLGYHLMKEAMFRVSSDTAEVRNFEYVPVRSTQMSLFPDFGRNHSIPLLKEVLLRSFAAKTLTVWDVYEEITVDTPYTLKNVKDAIIQLEAENRIGIDISANKRIRKGQVTLGDKRLVSFPV